MIQATAELKGENVNVLLSSRQDALRQTGDSGSAPGVSRGSCASSGWRNKLLLGKRWLEVQK